MRCSKCGMTFEDGEVFCPECGIRVSGRSGMPPEDAGKPAAQPETSQTHIAEQAAPSQGQDALREPLATAVEPPPALPTIAAEPALKPRNSGFAVASLILGMVGLTICPLLGSILALIFGLFGKSDIKHGKGSVKGSGMATAGITLGVIGIVIPLVFAAVAIPLGIIFVKPELKTSGNILDGASAARIFYFEHGNSFRGMKAADLSAINESVDFHMAPGHTHDVVYIEAVKDQSVRLYCYSSRNNKYTATARGELWHYSFRYWHGWLNDWDGLNNTSD